VLLGSAKLGGILIELQGEAQGPSAVVLGVGLNLVLSGHVVAAVGQPVADLSGYVLPARSVLLGAILNELAAVLACFEREGFAGVQAEWVDYHMYQGSRVWLIRPPEPMRQVRALGVDVAGALLVDAGEGVERVFSGEVSVRLAEDDVMR
jgi:BirA family biotin operon repressor/biotin-[acetyl-CoA-carboxylase] ligase